MITPLSRSTGCMVEKYINSDFDHVVTVAENMDNIKSVEANKANIDTVATNITTVNAVGTNIDHVTNVHNNMDKIISVEANKDIIDAVADNLVNINNVSTNMTAVVDVHTNMDTIKAVHADEEDIGKVATNITDVVKVANGMENYQVVERFTLLQGQLTIVCNDISAQAASVQVMGQMIDGTTLVPSVDYTVANNTITFKRSYPAGTTVTATQVVYKNDDPIIVIDNQSAFDRQIIPIAIGADISPYLQNGRTLYPRLLVGLVNYVNVDDISANTLVTSLTVTPANGGDIIVNTSQGNKIFSRKEAEATTKLEVLSDVFGSKPVDLVNGIVIAPIQNQYPKLAAFNAIYEVADNSVSYTVKSFAQSADKKSLIITLDDNTQISAFRADSASQHWTTQNFSKTFKTVAEMSTSTNLKEGQVVRTKGFYKNGDEGAATYLILNADLNGCCIQLANNLFALLSDTFDVAKFGIRSGFQYEQDDEFLRMQNYVNSSDVSCVDFHNMEITAPSKYVINRTSRGMETKGIVFKRPVNIKNLSVKNNQSKTLLGGQCCICIIVTRNFELCDMLLENITFDPYTTNYQLGLGGGEEDGGFGGFIIRNSETWLNPYQLINLKVRNITFNSPAISYNMHTSYRLRDVDVKNVTGEYWGLMTHLHGSGYLKFKDIHGVFRDDLHTGSGRVLVANLCHFEPEISSGIYKTISLSLENLSVIDTSGGLLHDAIKIQPATHSEDSDWEIGEITVKNVKGNFHSYPSTKSVWGWLNIDGISGGVHVEAKQVPTIKINKWSNQGTDTTRNLIKTVSEIEITNSSLYEPLSYDGSLVATKVRLRNVDVQNKIYGLCRDSKTQLLDWHLSDIKYHGGVLLVGIFGEVIIDGLHLTNENPVGFGNTIDFRNSATEIFNLSLRNVTTSEKTPYSAWDAFIRSDKIPHADSVVRMLNCDIFNGFVTDTLDNNLQLANCYSVRDSKFKKQEYPVVTPALALHLAPDTIDGVVQHSDDVLPSLIIDKNIWLENK